VTLIPMVFVSATTLTAGWMNITDNFWPLTANAATAVQGYVNSILTAVIMACAVVIIVEALRRWYRVLVRGQYSVAGQPVAVTEGNFSPPAYGCC